jgi:hypothetical protein
MTAAHDSNGGAHRHKSDRHNYGQKRPQFKTASNISICYLPPSSPFQNHSSQTLAIGRIHKCRSPGIYWRKSHLWLWPPGGIAGCGVALQRLLHQRRDGKSRSEAEQFTAAEERDKTIVIGGVECISAKNFGSDLQSQHQHAREIT